MPTRKAHITTHALYLDEEQLPELEEAVGRAASTALEGHPLTLSFNRLGNFSNAVVFGEVEHNPKLHELFRALTEEITAINGVQVKDTSTKKFNPHLTLLKTSRAKSRLVKKMKIPKEHYEDHSYAFLGSQDCHELQILSMLRPPARNGYYHCFAKVPFVACENHSIKGFPEINREKVQVRESVRQRVLRFFCSSSSPAPVLFRPKTLLVCSVIAFATYKLYKQVKKY